jgi:hypothetical protein
MGSKSLSALVLVLYTISNYAANAEEKFVRANILSYDGDKISIFIAFHRKFDEYQRLSSKVIPGKPFACAMFNYYRTYCLNSRNRGEQEILPGGKTRTLRYHLFVKPIPVLTGMFTWGSVNPISDSEYSEEMKKPTAKLKLLDLPKMATPEAISRLSQSFYWSTFISTDWVYEDATTTLDGFRALEVLDQLSELRPQRDCVLGADTDELSECGSFIKFDTGSVRGHAYCENLRLGDIWTAPYSCVALSVTRHGITYLAAFDSSEQYPAVGGGLSEGLQCEPEEDGVKFDGNFVNVVKEAIKTSKIDIDLQVQKGFSGEVALAGKKTFAKSKILDSRYEYTVAILYVHTDGLYLNGAITATVNSQDVRNRRDFLEMDEKEDKEYNNSVLRAIENRVSMAINRKYHCRML